MVMEQSKIDMFVATNKDFFPFAQMQIIKQKLESLPDEKANLLMATSFKNPTTMLIISIFLGGYGVDRFMLGDTGLGVAKLLTCGGCGIWAIIDWFLIKDKTYEYNIKKFNEATMLL
jgi:TM2 domain-containing membrane protein YozV